MFSLVLLLFWFWFWFFVCFLFSCCIAVVFVFFLFSFFNVIPFHPKTYVFRLFYLQGTPSAVQGGVSKVWLEQIIALPSAMALAPVQRTEMGGHRGHCFTDVIIPGGVSQFLPAFVCMHSLCRGSFAFSWGVFFFVSAKITRKTKMFH